MHILCTVSKVTKFDVKIKFFQQERTLSRQVLVLQKHTYKYVLWFGDNFLLPNWNISSGLSFERYEAEVVKGGKS